MTRKIYPCIWMDGTAKEAATFYGNALPGTKVIDENPYVVVIQSAGQNFMLLNGGPHYKVNPSISFYVHLTDTEAVESIWNNLLDGGNILMPLGAYPWSEKYGWVADKFGVNWQVALGKPEDVAHRYSPFFMFTGPNFGRAEEAVHFYTGIFSDSSIRGILKHKETPEAPGETVLHAQFSLCGQTFMAIDSGGPHEHNFNPAVSQVISCASQEEIDYYWEKLLDGGKEGMCGWLSDRFGVSWQVVPEKMGEWMRDPEKGPRVAQALMQMKKLDWDILENA